MENKPLFGKMYLFCIAFFCFSCATHVGKGLSTRKGCPYQRLIFIGNSTVTSTKGIQILDNLSAALTLEKNALVSEGNISNKFKLRATNIMDEVGEFEVPIDAANANEFVKLSNSICTLRKDLSGKKIFITPESRAIAVQLYTDLLGSVEGLKKKVRVNIIVEKIDTISDIIYFTINNSNDSNIEIGILEIEIIHRDTFHIGGDESGIPAPSKLLELQERIPLNLLGEKKENSDSYELFASGNKIIKLKANAAEYFQIKYSNVINLISNKLKTKYEELGIYPSSGNTWTEKKIMDAFGDLLFYINIKYNDPSTTTSAFIQSAKFSIE